MTSNFVPGHSIQEMHVRHLVRGADNGAIYDSVNPAMEEVTGVAADGASADMDAAIAAACRAFDETGVVTAQRVVAEGDPDG